MVRAQGRGHSALGAIDIALWDLRGKACGKPVRTLLGESRRVCPAYASGLLWNEPEQLAEEAARHLECGFRRMKMRLGRSEAYDTAGVHTVRQAIGPDHDVMVDVSMRYHVKLARHIGQVLEENRVFWFEEPFAPEDLDLYAALRGTVDVPIAAGENEFGRRGFEELIQRRAVDVVQPDACRCGGISEVWRVAKRAKAAGLHVAPHTWSDAVTVLANVQVVAAIPNGLTVEVDQTGNPFLDHLLAEPLRVVDGQLQLTEAPGLGVELDQAVVDQYRMDDPLDIPDGQYADMVFGPQHAKSTDFYEELSP